MWAHHFENLLNSDGETYYVVIRKRYNLKNYKAQGYDGISSALLKSGGAEECTSS